MLKVKPLFNEIEERSPHLLTPLFQNLASAIGSQRQGEKHRSPDLPRKKPFDWELGEEGALWFLQHQSGVESLPQS